MPFELVSEKRGNANRPHWPVLRLTEDELAIGLTPMEVIEAATRHAAYACGHEDEIGTLQPGKLGDLIVIPGNPLQDINALSQISLVVKDGMIAHQSEGS
jgi:imidazolonepropionase-like amidohydrolase